MVKEPELKRSELNKRKKKVIKPLKHKYFTAFLFVFVVLLGIFFLYLGHLYKDAQEMTTKIYSSSKITKARNTQNLLKEGKPISILLMGTDTGAVGRSFKGRTDTMIVLTLNPQKKKMTIVSLPRDALVAVTGYKQYYPSKLNSAYDYGGSGTAIKTVQNYLNIPIDFYATINMGGLENMVNAVGGITVKPLLTFSYDGHSFVKNKKTHMNGSTALAYVRMRHSDPLGDYGRQQRQRQVLTKVAQNGTKLKSLLKERFFKEIQKQLKTDITFNDMIMLALKYRVATRNMTSDHLQGEADLVSGISFEAVPETEKQRITNLIRSSLNLETATTGNTLLNSSSINTTEK
ncbi:LCP family protein [Liquorilactobacillus mali]|uniref:LCP family protein n=1 Tax=Liquorilactobacillus mali TaxID=1618 RepID=UPI002350685B|nr:LCP family protein [Liquorilactobacillus mali]MDC7953433.1 LCP family protein [Liquorilactobacillus mali]MDV7757807.1 LytR family transcriptional regulator [Liquorilactobacillus mali]